MAPIKTPPPPPPLVVTPPVDKTTTHAATKTAAPVATNTAVAPDYNAARTGQAALHHGETAPTTAGSPTLPSGGLTPEEQTKWKNFIGNRPGPRPDLTVDDPKARNFVAAEMTKQHVSLSDLLDRTPMGGAQRDLIAHFGAHRSPAEVGDAVAHVLSNPAKFPNGLSLVAPMVEEAALQTKVGKHPEAAQAAFNGIMDKVLTATDHDGRGTSLDTLRHNWKGAASEIDAYGRKTVQDFSAKVGEKATQLDSAAIGSLARENASHLARMGTKEMVQLSHQLENMKSQNAGAFGSPNTEGLMLGLKLYPPPDGNSGSGKAYDYTEYKYQMEQFPGRNDPAFQKTFSQFVLREPGLQAAMRTAHEDYKVKISGGDMKQQEFERTVIENVFVQADLTPPQ